jgi:hypothetical protein
VCQALGRKISLVKAEALEWAAADNATKSVDETLEIPDHHFY